MKKNAARRAASTLIALSLSPLLPTTVYAQCGSASWYALTSKTASGERMNPSAMTAAHRKLPFGTTVKVVNSRNGKAVVVRINDRGPFVTGRIIDLSKAAAAKLDFVSAGHTKVCLEMLK